MKKPVNHVLYRFFNTDGELLYVGITQDIINRHRGHARDKTWFGEVASSTMTHYPTRGELVEAEWHAIRTEQPKYNKAHSTLPQPLVMRVQRKPRGVAFGSHASRFGRPDAIADEELNPLEAQVLQHYRSEQQLAQLKDKLAEEYRGH